MRTKTIKYKTNALTFGGSFFFHLGFSDRLTLRVHCSQLVSKDTNERLLTLNEDLDVAKKLLHSLDETRKQE